MGFADGQMQHFPLDEAASQCPRLYPSRPTYRARWAQNIVSPAKRLTAQLRRMTVLMCPTVSCVSVYHADSAELYEILISVGMSWMRHVPY